MGYILNDFFILGGEGQGGGLQPSPLLAAPFVTPWISIAGRSYCSWNGVAFGLINSNSCLEQVKHTEFAAQGRV
jgi:hypothetical protein